MTQSQTPLPLLRAASTAALLAVAATGQSLAGQYGEVVLSNGQPAPGIPTHTIYIGSSFAFGTPVLDQNGNVLVQARLAPSGTDDRAIFYGQGDGDMQLVAQSGTQAPGLPVGTLLQSNSTSSGSGLENDPMVSPTGGIVYFGSRIYDPGNPANTPTTSDSALFWGPVGGITMLAREGEQVPGLPNGINFGALTISRQYNKINANGRVTLPCALSGAVTASDDAVLLTGSLGSFDVVLREGQDAGLGNGEVWIPASGSTMSFTVIMNGNDQILLAPRLGGTATAADDNCIAIYVPGAGAQVIAREGNQVPGLAAGVVFSGSPGLGSSAFNDSGDAVFNWTVSGPGITSDNDQVTCLGGLGGVTVIRQEGDPTGLPNGERFGVANNSSVNLGNGGTIAFYTSLRDASGGALPTTNDAVMVVGTPGNWSFPVREGEPIAIPPSANGTWVAGNVTGTTNVNANGQLLFNQSADDGTGSTTLFLVWDAVHGLVNARDGSESYTGALGTGNATSSTSTGGAFSGSAGSPIWFDHAGDFVFRQSIDNNVEAAIVKVQSGVLAATPSTISEANGGTQTFAIDAGAAHAGDLYAVIGTASGTTPGTVVPLGPLTIPLNFDAYTDLTVALFNTSVFSNTLSVLDANGRATAALNLPAAAGLPAGTLLHHAVVGLDFTLSETFVSEPATVKIF